jgi:hypothetical protein
MDATWLLAHLALALSRQAKLKQGNATIFVGPSRFHKILNMSLLDLSNRNSP